MQKKMMCESCNIFPLMCNEFPGKDVHLCWVIIFYTYPAGCRNLNKKKHENESHFIINSCNNLDFIYSMRKKIPRWPND